MKQIILCFFVLIGSATIKAQDMDGWTVYMTPNEIHKMLSEYTGEFNMEIAMWMVDGGEPVILNVNSVNKMILGGGFLEMRQSGEMMGMEYQSLSILGYNTISKSLGLTTITNMGTGFLYLEGTWDEEKKVATLKGQMTNPMDGKIIKILQQISFIDKDNLLVENFDTYEGQPAKKSLQYKLVRKK